MYSEIVSTINAAINLLYNCNEGDNEITEDLENVRQTLEEIWKDDLAKEDAERENEGL